MALADYVPQRLKAAGAALFQKSARRPGHVGMSREARELVRLAYGNITTEGPAGDAQRIQLIQEHPVAMWCVRRISQSAASVPYQLVDANGRPVQGNHPAAGINEMLEFPNPNQSRSDLFQLVSASLAATGNAYLYAPRSEITGLPVALYFLRPDRMVIRPKPEDQTQVAAYTYTMGSGSQTFAPEDICHIRHQWLTKDASGFAAFNSVWEPAELYQGLIRLTRKILENSGGIPGALVFSTEKGLSDTQRAEMKEMIASFRIDGDKFGQLMLLDLDQKGTAQFLPLAGDISKVQPTETKLDAARDICLAFGVPPLLYTSDGPTYSNYQEANRSFWMETVVPGYVDPIASGLTRYFGVPIKADLSEVPALSKLNTANVNMIKALQGVLTVNEMRERLGYPAHAMGDRIIVNPAAISLDTQLATADANAVTNIDPRLLQGILEADAQSRALLGKALRMLDEGTDEAELAKQLAGLGFKSQRAPSKAGTKVH